MSMCFAHCCLIGAVAKDVVLQRGLQIAPQRFEARRASCGNDAAHPDEICQVVHGVAINVRGHTRVLPGEALRHHDAPRQSLHSHGESLWATRSLHIELVLHKLKSSACKHYSEAHGEGTDLADVHACCCQVTAPAATWHTHLQEAALLMTEHDSVALLHDVMLMSLAR